MVPKSNSDTFERAQQKVFPLFCSQLGTTGNIKRNEEMFALHFSSGATFLIPTLLWHLGLFGFLFCHARCLQIS